MYCNQVDQFIRQTRVVSQDSAGERVAEQLECVAVADLPAAIRKLGELSNIVKQSARNHQVTAERHMISLKVFLLLLKGLNTGIRHISDVFHPCNIAVRHEPIGPVGEKRLFQGRY